ncbi:MAG TPA: condensation domain-containing protein, partial [Bryobacteraceae bacterium]
MPSAVPETLPPEEPVLLGPVERIFWLLEENSVGSFRVTLVLRLDGCIEANLLTAALRRLQCRHPKLRAVIVKGSDGRLRYQFDRLAPPIPLEISDHDEVEFPWRQTARRLMESGFPPAGPLIAVNVLRSRSRGCCELLLSVHHAVADGLSSIMLVEDLLTEYARGEVDPEVAPRPVLAAVTAISAKTSGGWSGRLWLLRRLRRMIREDRAARHTSLPETRGIPSQSQWVHWVFSRENTLELIRRCRRERVSLGAALEAAVFCGLIDCLPFSKALFKCTFPFDLREALAGPVGRITPQDLGCFVSIMNEYYEVGKKLPFWDLARRAHQNHQTFVKCGGPAFYYNLAALAAFIDK